MNTVLLLTGDHIRAILRNRLLLGLMLISVAVTTIFSFTLAKVEGSVRRVQEQAAKAQAEQGKSPVTAETRRNQQAGMQMMEAGFQAFFYQTASFGGSLVALFIFSTAVATEIRTGTIRVTLSKPVSRFQFLAGKFLGGMAVMVAYALLVSLALMVFLRAHEAVMSPTMKYAPLLMFSRQLMLGSFALLLSLFVHPFIASILAFFAGNGLYSAANPLYYLLPSYAPFNVFGQLMQGTFLPARKVLLLELYALDFVVLMLLLAWWRFRSKELV